MEPIRLRSIHLGLGSRGLALLRAAAVSGLFEPAAAVDTNPEWLHAAQAAADVEGFEELSDASAAVDAEAVLIALPLHERVEAAMQALANDLHVLVVAPLAADREEAQRCVFISQNRGVRLMLADLDREAPEEMLRQFHSWIFGGPEPLSSGRRSLGTE